MHWKKKYRRPVLPISLHLVKEGHCINKIISGGTIMHRRPYQSVQNPMTGHLRDLTLELDANYSIDEVAAQLGIAHLLG